MVTSCSGEVDASIGSLKSIRRGPWGSLWRDGRQAEVAFCRGLGIERFSIVFYGDWAHLLVEAHWLKAISIVA